MLLAIVGPTASGKTALSVEVAGRLDGELVSADSRQVIRGCDIGTGKPGSGILHGIPCHMLDVVEPGQSFTVADYQQLALKVIAGILARGRLPILVGGTGLYVRAVLSGYNMAGAPPDPAFRAALESRLGRDGLEPLLAELREIDPAAAQLAGRNPRRVIRALEIHAVTGRSPSAARASRPPSFQVILLGLSLEIAELDRRIERRVDAMLEVGLVAEAARLQKDYPGLDLQALGIGYAEMARHLSGDWSLAEARDAMVRNTRRYARRQLTWFKAQPGLKWIDPVAQRVVDIMESEREIDFQP